MPFPLPINEALENYDKNKGFWRRLFRFDQAAIRALRGLNKTDQVNTLKLYGCFIGNKPKNTQESFKVYEALLNYLESIDFSNIPEILNLLHSNQLLNSSNLEKINPLTGDHIQDISEMLSSMLASVDKLHKGNSLNQENLKYLLKKPLQSENMANILLILDQNHILTSENRIQLCNEKNELLLRNKAYYGIWHPLEDYLLTVVNIHERQRIFDHLICLTQTDEEIEEIEKYINGLIAEAKPARRYTFDKFATAPSPRIRTRTMISDSSLTRERPGTL
ncbi:hypothetical protein FQR65_LT05082 [Abscondita terminalis]|nr:hypothetical protein FQR65_LT05082 [Abscondita terminalis]